MRLIKGKTNALLEEEEEVLVALEEAVIEEEDSTTEGMATAIEEIGIMIEEIEVHPTEDLAVTEEGKFSTLFILARSRSPPAFNNSRRSRSRSGGGGQGPPRFEKVRDYGGTGGGGRERDYGGGQAKETERDYGGNDQKGLDEGPGSKPDEIDGFSSNGKSGGEERGQRDYGGSRVYASRD